MTAAANSRTRARHRTEPIRARRLLGLLLAVVVTAIYALNLGFGFEGSFSGSGDFQFVSRAFRQNSHPAGNRFAETPLGNGFRDELVLLLPAVVILAVVSSQTGFSAHMRYVLPIFPFVFVWISQIAPLVGAGVCFRAPRTRSPPGVAELTEFTRPSPPRQLLLGRG